MKKTAIWLPLLAVLIVTAVPAVAAAQPSALVNTLSGSALDPTATTVRVVPPRGGTVMVYQKGKVVGWWMRAGLATVKPNQVYGVLATRGSQMLFNNQVMMRPGSTELIWSDGSDLPQMAYYPALGWRQPAQRTSAARFNGRRTQQQRARTRRSRRATSRRTRRIARRRIGMGGAIQPMGNAQARPRSAARTGRTARVGRTAQRSNARAAQQRNAQSEQRNAARVVTRSAISAHDYKRMLRAMDYADNDRARLTVVRSFARRFSFDSEQRRTILGRFAGGNNRSSAAKLLHSSN